MGLAFLQPGGLGLSMEAWLQGDPPPAGGRPEGDERGGEAPGQPERPEPMADARRRRCFWRRAGDGSRWWPTWCCFWQVGRPTQSDLISCHESSDSGGRGLLRWRWAVAHISESNRTRPRRACETTIRPLRRRTSRPRIGGLASRSRGEDGADEGWRADGSWMAKVCTSLCPHTSRAPM